MRGCSNRVHASQKIVRYLQRSATVQSSTVGFALYRHIFSCWPPVEDERDNTVISCRGIALAPRHGEWVFFQPAWAIGRCCAMTSPGWGPTPAGPKTSVCMAWPCTSRNSDLYIGCSPPLNGDAMRGNVAKTAWCSVATVYTMLTIECQGYAMGHGFSSLLRTKPNALVIIGVLVIGLTQLEKLRQRLAAFEGLRGGWRRLFPLHNLSGHSLAAALTETYYTTATVAVVVSREQQSRSGLQQDCTTPGGSLYISALPCAEDNGREKGKLLCLYV